MLANADSADHVRQEILDVIRRLMDDRGLDTSSLNEAAKLVDTLGLKSMDIAEIVLVLEDELETDPFQEIPITSIRTVADLIRAYQSSLDPATHPVVPDTDGPSISPGGAPRRAGRRR